MGAKSQYDPAGIPISVPVLSPVAAESPASNTNAVETLAADATRGWTIYQIFWSYSATPTGGLLTIVWGANTETYAITGSGQGAFTWTPPRSFPVNTQVTIMLAAGGSGISGTVYANARVEA